MRPPGGPRPSRAARSARQALLCFVDPTAAPLTARRWRPRTRRRQADPRCTPRSSPTFLTRERRRGGFSRPCGARACSASSPTDLPVNGARSRSKGTAFRMCLPKSDLYRVCLHCLIPGAPSCSTPGVSSTWSGVNAIFPEERGISIDHAPAAHHDIVNVCGEAVLGRPPTRDLRASRRVAPLHHAALRLGRPPPWSGAHWWLHL